MRLVVLAVASCVIITGCSKQADTQASTNTVTANATEEPATFEALADAAAEAAPEPEQPSGWESGGAVDAMTDERILTAGITLQGNTNDVQVIVKCHPARQLVSYSIMGFDKQKLGAALRQSNGTRPVKALDFRVDGGKQERILSGGGYANQITFIEDNKSFPIATAGSVVLRLYFTNSIETYTLDQRAIDFTNTVASCTSQPVSEETNSEDLSSTPSSVGQLPSSETTDAATTDQAN